MTKVKICGIMNHRDMELCVKYGPHTLGFVVEYPTPVPWNISAATAKKLIESAPALVSTCIVTGGSAEKVIALAIQTKPHFVQLHYNETLKDVKYIAHELKKYGIKTIKALRMDQSGACAFEINDPIQAVRELENTDISAILVDSYTEHLPGGTGVVVNLDLFSQLQKIGRKPLILAGGIKPTNVNEIISQTNPYGIDILSGVEDAPGCKSEKKIGALMRKLDNCNR